MDKEYLAINNSRLQIMLKSAWTEGEKPLLTAKIDFQESQNEFYLSGIIMATYGAIYLFKTTMISGPEYYNKYHLLDCTDFYVQQNSFTMTFKDNSLLIKSNEIVPIVDVLLSMFSECTNGVKNFKFMTIRSDIPLPDYNDVIRSSSALRHRSLFLAHYYHIKSNQITALDYFTKFETSHRNLLVLGNKFHPGNFATAIGHAIGWDPTIATVCFQSCVSSKFSPLVNAIMKNAQKIERIAFADYKERNPVSFQLEPISKTSIKRYWFLRSCGLVIRDLFSNANQISSPMDEIIIASCVLRPQEFGDIVTCFSESESACNVRYLYLVRVSMKPFPFFDITRLLGFTQNLVSLTFRACLDIDATHLLKAICSSKTRLRALGLTHLQFRTDVPFDLELPKSLTLLNISFSSFTDTSFKTLIELLLYKTAKIPFIFQAHELVLKTSAYEMLSQLDFNKLLPNFCEIDWSGNYIPKDSIKYFFAFLFTQSKCHLLSMNELTCGDSTLFLSCLTQLLHIIPIKGLDLSGKFPTSVFSQFVDSLKDLKLLRLSLSCKNTSDTGLDCYRELVKVMPSIIELGADGFRPHTPQPFFEFWKEISERENILSCDFPNEDMFVLGLAMQRLGPEIVDTFNKIQKKTRLSTLEGRLNYLIEITKEYVSHLDNESIPFDEESFKNRMEHIGDVIFQQSMGRTSEYTSDSRGLFKEGAKEVSPEALGNDEDNFDQV
ncbi:hypothetical protein TVAG_390040 [Trichomonas vaginalis G3]|uniref:Uncharacterized protein n=1 Tax=Trichomonas vaginalis (strain ATCC PRA-98 / G3) TaxID=412133 RepID=A2E1A6_TRIV3|nr:RNI-like family [Trichomonas vaginalis G3]EAY13607.1 hypothetical protein TVAG_390040 [Trichomonas vaginalis G3]KAI5489987.1 RNI-like family [Trichomonas vaginalis G3]|eukprot:XP_001325830.1 hypothetical protein [Trichomonas vaginalis G3]